MAALQKRAQGDLVDDAERILLEAYGEAAGVEALNRALDAERSSDTDRARFWTQVYQEVAPRLRGL